MLEEEGDKGVVKGKGGQIYDVEDGLILKCTLETIWPY